MPEPIKAIVIDPQEKTVQEIAIPTKEPDPDAGCGLQLEFDYVHNLLGCRSLEFVWLPNGKDVLILDEEGRVDGDAEKDFFELGPQYAPMAGMAVIVGHDRQTDTYRDIAMTVEDVAEILRWRYVRGVKVSEPRKA